MSCSTGASATAAPSASSPATTAASSPPCSPPPRSAADTVYLNTSFAGPQLADVVAREGVDVIVHDNEFAPLVAHCAGVATIGGDELAELTARRAFRRVEPTRRAGRQIVLTSGTTGRPKGARRPAAASATTLAGLLAIPLRTRDTVVIAAPLFHAWGLAHLGAALATSTTAIVHAALRPGGDAGGDRRASAPAASSSCR